MGLRFRKYINLAPGVRMNLSGSGASLTIGPRGASIGIGRRGTYINTGIPGTGIYSRSKIQSTPAPAPVQNAAGNSSIAIKVSINDEGVISFIDSQGNPLSEHVINLAKKQHGPKIKAMIQQQCDEINVQVEALGNFHFNTPPPVPPTVSYERYMVPRPLEPILKEYGFFCKLFKFCRDKVDAENKILQDKYSTMFAEWEGGKAEYETVQAAKNALIRKVIAGEAKSVQQYVEDVLREIVWPRETHVSFEVYDGGTLAFEVDLPEIEEMPNKTAMAPQRGMRLSVKEMSPTQVQRLYVRHIHGVGFRIIGEAFAASPTANTIILSAYSQRPNKATGQVGNEYLYSVKVSREMWSKINFDNLDALDVVEAFGQFELNRNMSKTGVFKPITPFVC